MLRASWIRRVLHFNFAAITSRNVMTAKETYFIYVWDEAAPTIRGVGECAIFRGLSSDDTPFYSSRLQALCESINTIVPSQIPESSIRFGLETALADLESGGHHDFWPSDWSLGKVGIPINGLIWMGDWDTMRSRIDEKLNAGYRCIKIKIGALDFDKEEQLIAYLRSMDSKVEIRLDANGAFSPREALQRIERLARYDIHSMEQPIRSNQWSAMREICRESPIPIALDEELIGNMSYDSRCRLLDKVTPTYIILKPSLCGGFSTADGWIRDATEREIRWWATSALESDIGLNAIARWVALKKTDMPQGLGTGMLYTNNIESPLHVAGSNLFNDPTAIWGQLP